MIIESELAILGMVASLINTMLNTPSLLLTELMGDEVGANEAWAFRHGMGRME
jgi:hypothetical protein